VIEERIPVFMSVITVGELRNGVEKIRRRGATQQAGRLERWLETLLADYPEQILGIDADTAQLWGVLQMPTMSSALDWQIAATARIHDLTLVTTKDNDFDGAGIAVLNPFRTEG
jgi:predicted nucleic acid-binding protein